MDEREYKVLLKGECNYIMNDRFGIDRRCFVVIIVETPWELVFTKLHCFKTSSCFISTIVIPFMELSFLKGTQKHFQPPPEDIQRIECLAWVLLGHLCNHLPIRSGLPSWAPLMLLAPGRDILHGHPDALKAPAHGCSPRQKASGHRISGSDICSSLLVRWRAYNARTPGPRYAQS